MSYANYTESSQVKMVYVASMDDQVVPVYSGAFTCVSHPLILRALYINGDAYRYVVDYFCYVLDN